MLAASHRRKTLAIQTERFCLSIGWPRFLNLGAEGTRGFKQRPLAAGAAPIQESVLPKSVVCQSLPRRRESIAAPGWIPACAGKTSKHVAFKRQQSVRLASFEIFEKVCKTILLEKKHLRISRSVLGNLRGIPKDRQGKQFDQFL